MKAAIKDLKGSSALNYPGSLAAMIFMGGCNLACPFCHNPLLAGNSNQLQDIPRETVLGWLKSRNGFDDGVVITGGEPTLFPDLYNLIRQVKGLGFSVKLDTNGLRPEVLKPLLDNHLLDYVALDLKTDPRRYAELGGKTDPAALIESFLMIRKAAEQDGLDYEVRTTCVPGLVEANDINAIGSMMGACHRWFLQQYAPEHAIPEAFRARSPHSASTLQAFAELAREYAMFVGIRGV